MNNQSISYRMQRFFMNFDWMLAIQYLILAGLIIGLTIGGYVGYSWYRDRYERSAQKMLTQVIQAYESAQKSQKPKDWESVATLSQNAFDQYKSANIAPYFLVFKAHALFADQKPNDAFEVLHTARSLVSDPLVMRSMIRTMYGLAALDSTDKTVHDKGLEELNTLARESHNPLRDMAQYYLGDYLYSTQDYANARAIWNLIMDTQYDKPENQSSWLPLVRDRIATIGG